MGKISRSSDRTDIWDILWKSFLGILIIIMVVAQTIASPTILSNWNTAYNYLIKTLLGVTSLGLVAGPFTYIIITGNLDLSCSSIITFGAVLACNLSAKPWYDTHPFLCIATAILVPLIAGTLCGLFNGYLIGYLKLSPFITTLGTQYVISLASLLYNKGKYETARTNSPGFAFIGRASFLGIPVALLLLLISFLIFGFILHRTVYGRQIYAIGGSRQAAKFAGIKVERVVLSTYTLTGLMAGLSGLFLASWTMAVDQNVGKGKEFEIATAVILGGASITGGIGKMSGTVLGIIFLGVLIMFYVQFEIPGSLQYVVKGILLIAVVLLSGYLERRKDLASLKQS